MRLRPCAAADKTVQTKNLPLEGGALLRHTNYQFQIPQIFRWNTKIEITKEIKVTRLWWFPGNDWLTFTLSGIRPDTSVITDGSVHFYGIVFSFHSISIIALNIDNCVIYTDKWLDSRELYSSIWTHHICKNISAISVMFQPLKRWNMFI